MFQRCRFIFRQLLNKSLPKRHGHSRRIQLSARFTAGAYQQIEMVEPRVMLSATSPALTSTAPDNLMLDMHSEAPADLTVSMHSELPTVSAQPELTEYEAWRNETFYVDTYTQDEIEITNEGDISTQDQAMFDLINLGDVYTNTSYRGTGYSVAVLDTGVDYTHTALGGGWGNRVIAGYDFVNNDSDPMDDNGHGTHVAGTIGGNDLTHGGIANDVNIIALKVLGASGSGSFGDVEDALQWVAANQATYNIVAVNMSLGAGNHASNPYTFLEDEFTTLVGQGVFIAASSGNDFYTYGSTQGLGYPAISNNTVSVGAVYDTSYGQVNWSSGATDYTTAADRITSFTQRSSGLDILAPGAMITAAGLGGGFVTMGGTSMAAPVIAGAAALMHEAAVDTGQTNLANQTSLLQIMQDTGVSINDGDDENDNVTNTGLNFKRIDLYAALQDIMGPESSPSSDYITITDGVATIAGTTGDDTFVISISGTTMNVSRNSVADTIDLTAVTAINLEGGDGTDSLTYTGQTAADSFKLWEGRLQHTLTDLVFDSDTLETIILNGGGGEDTALMYDTSGNDTLNMEANAVQMTGTGYSNAVNGINTVTAFSNNGGTDAVTFTDTAADDYFVSKYNQAYMTTGDYRNTAVNFESGTATSANGGNDRAWFYDSTGDDTLTMDPTSVNMTGTTFNNTANDFYRVDAYGDNGGTDSATINDSAGNDRSYSSITYSYMTGTGFYNRVNNFDSVTVNATSGGSDRADFYGTDADETFTAQQQGATLSGNGATVTVTSFDLIAADMTYGSGTDSATLTDTTGNDTFKAYSDFSFMYGSGYKNYVYGFDTVVGNSTEGGTDRAYLVDSSGDDTMTVNPTSVNMTGTGFNNTANGFSRTDTYTSEGGTDTANFYDSSGDDIARATPLGLAYMQGSGFVNVVRYLENVNFYTNNGGTDKAYFYDTSGNDTFTVNSLAGSIIGTGYTYYAYSFEIYAGYSNNGGTDAAWMYGNSGDDTVTAYPDQVTLTSTGLKVYAFDFENTYTTAGSTGGNDRAYLYDSSGNDTYLSRPDSTKMSGTGYQNNVINFDRVDAIAENGGTDTANIYDTAGDDNVYLRPDYTALLSSSYDTYAYGFNQVNAYADNGGTDRARYYDSSGDDIYTSDQASSNMIGTGFANYANSFEIYIVYGSSGGTDTANLDDTAGDDTVTINTASTTFTSSGVTTVVNSFEDISATATNGGNDIAIIYGTNTTDDSIFWGDTYLDFSTSTFDSIAYGFETADAYDIGQSTINLNDLAGTETFNVYSDRISKDNGTSVLTIWTTHRVVLDCSQGGTDIVNFYDTNVLDRAEVDYSGVNMIYEDDIYKYKLVSGSSIDTMNLYASNSGVDVANYHDYFNSFDLNYFGGWVENDHTI